MFKSVAGISKKDNKFLLGKRKSGGSIGGKWEFPGGKVEENESLKDALIREYLEELGVLIKVDEFIIEKEFISKDHNFFLYAFYIKIEDEDFKYFEHDKFKYYTLDELYQLENLADSDKLLLEYL